MNIRNWFRRPPAEQLEPLTTEELYRAVAEHFPGATVVPRVDPWRNTAQAVINHEGHRLYVSTVCAPWAVREQVKTIRVHHDRRAARTRRRELMHWVPKEGR